mmetsp:Transcript_19976/g.46886  ORF Transcript_19976/g.46886 Transcript_19976/m.46886 type:complete len:281 (+) Transcript_19976:72-914(+)
MGVILDTSSAAQAVMASIRPACPHAANVRCSWYSWTDQASSTCWQRTSRMWHHRVLVRQAARTGWRHRSLARHGFCSQSADNTRTAWVAGCHARRCHARCAWVAGCHARCAHLAGGAWRPGWRRDHNSLGTDRAFASWQHAWRANCRPAFSRLTHRAAALAGKSRRCTKRRPTLSRLPAWAHSTNCTHASVQGGVSLAWRLAFHRTNCGWRPRRCRRADDWTPSGETRGLWCSRASRLVPKLGLRRPRWHRSRSGRTGQRTRCANGSCAGHAHGHASLHV